MFNSIDSNQTAEITEKKSKFIANVISVSSKEEAEKCINDIKKKNPLARHNCYAYSIYSKEGIQNKMSDDGEPSGTAGAPLLNILTSREITNTLIVVTRYFGGILLGTGGLVRAYTSAAQAALEKVNIIKKDLGLIVKIVVSYSDVDKLKYYLSQKKTTIVDSEYLENIILKVEISKEDYDTLTKEENDLNFHIINKAVIEETYINI